MEKLKLANSFQEIVDIYHLNSEEDLHCPFCKEKIIFILHAIKVDRYAIFCFDCHSRGPSEKTVENAIKKFKKK